MLLRIIAASVVCLCLLFAPALQAFGEENNSLTATASELLAFGGENNSLTATASELLAFGKKPGKDKPAQVPEPSATLLLAFALGGVVAFKRHCHG